MLSCEEINNRLVRSDSANQICLIDKPNIPRGKRTTKCFETSRFAEKFWVNQV